MITTFTKLPNGEWGVLVKGQPDEINALTPGTVVEVSKRNGGFAKRTLANRVSSDSKGTKFAVEQRQFTNNVTVTQEGLYELDGEEYRVRLNKDGTRHYALRFDVATQDYVYDKGAIYRLKPENLVRADSTDRAPAPTPQDDDAVLEAEIERRVAERLANLNGGVVA